jgi:hypothetical protein
VHGEGGEGRKLSCMYEYRCILDLDEKIARRVAGPGNFLG